uniref:C3/C5 convertase n=1 Tax=Oryzias latipes TaxID=8090 RepID=A0A3P9I0B0_ORYLA
MRTSVIWSLLVFLLLCTGEVECQCTADGLEIQGGTYTLTKGLETNSLLVYQCPDNFYPYPDTIRVCHPNKQWKPRPKKFSPQRCKPVECPDPNVLENGNVFPPLERYLAGNTTTFECYSGYTMRGSSSRTCLSNGKWSGSTTICSRDSGDACPDPGVPPGASRRGNTFDVGYDVTYSCNGNLFLVGSRVRVCQENSQWTGREPACYSKFTYDTSQEVSEAFGSSIKDSLTTLQPTNDTQAGRKIRISKNGTLNIYIALDISESVEEEHFKRAKLAIITLIKKISAFTVSPNYEILFFSADVYEVVSIVEFYEGKITLESAIKNLEDFQIGDKSTGTDVNAALKKFEEGMAWIEQKTGDKFSEHRHVFLLFTDGAYNMGGSPLPTLARIKNRVYMSPTGDPGSRLDYLESYVFGIGANIFDDDLLPLTAGTEGELHYFRLKKETNLAATFDDIIDENEVIGLCGLHRDYELTADKDGKRRRYPWVVFINIQGKSPKRCLGSLVSSEFVLTAAHCFIFSDEPQDVKVEIDDGKGSKEKKVKTFKLHPQYNVTARVKQGVAEFYDYDIALIQLERPVQLSISSRPICIPCTKETSDALKLPGSATCRDQEELLLKNQRERLSFLTRTEPLVGEKDVYAKLGDNRDLCIKKALKAKGITTTDPKVPVTDNFLCTGGDRDHIACTGDSGGAVFKNYESRTIQIALVSWGTQEICTGGGMRETTPESRDFHINLFKMVPFLKSILGDDDQDDYAPLTFIN